MPNRFLRILFPLVLLLAAQPLVVDQIIPGFVTRILGLLTIAGALRIMRPYRTLVAMATILLVVGIVAVPLSGSGVGGPVDMVGAVSTIVAMVTIVLVIAYEAVTEHWVTGDTVLGALVVYLLIGVTATYVYDLIEISSPGSFTNLQGTMPAAIFAELNYFSLVTLTTLGYGDIAPVQPLARIVATFEAVVGQFFVAAVVGLLVSRGGAQRSVRPAPTGAES